MNKNYDYITCECNKEDKCYYCHVCISNATEEETNNHIQSCMIVKVEIEMNNSKENNLESVNIKYPNSPIKPKTSNNCCSCDKKYCYNCGRCFTIGCSYNKGNCHKCIKYKTFLESNDFTNKISNNESVTGTYIKLSNGTWAIKIKNTFNEQAQLIHLAHNIKVEVHKKNGDVIIEKIDKYHSSTTPKFNGVEYISYSIYTINTKYKKGGYSPEKQTEENNNKPKHKTSNSNKKYTTDSKHSYNHDKYDFLVWEFNISTNKYELTTEMLDIDQAASNILLSTFADKNSNSNNIYKYIAIVRPINHNYDYATSYDRTLGDKTLLNEQLHKYIAKKDVLENLDKKWIMCTMNCVTFPARGQKIKGILGLSSAIKGVAEYSKIENAIVVSENLDIENIIHKHHYENCRHKIEDIIPNIKGKFMRPVPHNPEHGFVDSRLVKTEQDVLEVIEEIRKTGEIPEFIAMPLIDCQYSGVITPDMISLGKGHDGATQGLNAFIMPLEIDDKDRDKLSKMFWDVEEGYCPVCKITSKVKYSSTICIKCNNLLERKWPYVETLYEDQYTYPTVVQLRSGPELKIENEKIKVKYVKQIDSSMDLIEWGKLSKQLKEDISINENGTKDLYSRTCPVIWHPGGAISSHFGVHCKETKLPYITSTIAPKEGDIIEIGIRQNTNVEAFREGLVIGLETSLVDLEKDGRKKAKRYLKNFLAALHGYALLDLGNAEVARFIGFSFAVGTRVVSALPIGEARHKKESRKLIENIIDIEFKKLNNHHTMCSCGACRGLIYSVAWLVDLSISIRALTAAYDSFRMPIWGGSDNLSGAYGGKKWASCTLSTLNIFIAFRGLLKASTIENVTEIVDKINIMVNEAHNGGWFLNKLLTKNDFDKAGELPHFFFSPEMAFKMREEYSKEGKYALKVKAFKYAKIINIEELVYNGIMDLSVKIPVGLAIKEEENIYTGVSKSKEPIELIKTYSQDEIKKSIIKGSEIEIQYNNSTYNLHIQIKCYNINRPYGYSIGYEWLQIDPKNAGMLYTDCNEYYLTSKTVNSLTGSDNQYSKTKAFRSSIKGYIIIIFAKNYCLVKDEQLSSEMRKIQEYQVSNSIISAVDILNSKKEDKDVKKVLDIVYKEEVKMKEYEEYLKENDLYKYYVTSPNGFWKNGDIYESNIGNIIEQFPYSKPADIAKGYVKDIINAINLHIEDTIKYGKEYK